MNYMNYPNKFNYQANILPSSQGNNVYSPYEGFIRGNMFQSLYKPYKQIGPYRIEAMNEQAEMLTNIDALCFALIDLNLYLDVFPNDKNAVDMFNQYRVQKNELQKQYENKYGPLVLTSDAINTYPWAWDNKPWPWEN